ncbi:MAG: HD domain-containing protein [Nitrososphaerota archaeon]|nr:HD domain-containing protein [Candidatus Calditenuaceae archaeon]MDW8073418.1 HD domain-containing protein [Nitrososphaerota archaeon]
MARVSDRLVEEKVRGDELLSALYMELENDEELQTALRLCNDMVVKRLYYNDHGPTHARIVAGSALEILDILARRGLKPVTVQQGLNQRDAAVVVLLSAYLHDIGNMIHREMHHLTGVYLASGILSRILPKHYPDLRTQMRMRQEILHSILAHDDSVQALSLESGVIKLADGTDMAEGRARYPYTYGKSDIHAFSALAIKSVELKEGDEVPLVVEVDMVNEAGVFQVEEVYGKKIETSGLERFVTVRLLLKGKYLKSYSISS